MAVFVPFKFKLTNPSTFIFFSSSISTLTYNKIGKDFSSLSKVISPSKLNCLLSVKLFKMPVKSDVLELSPPTLTIGLIKVPLPLKYDTETVVAAEITNSNKKVNTYDKNFFINSLLPNLKRFNYYPLHFLSDKVLSPTLLKALEKTCLDIPVYKQSLKFQHLLKYEYKQSMADG